MTLSDVAHKKLTHSLEAAALYYLQRFASAEANFRQVMWRKIEKREASKQLSHAQKVEMIDAVTLKMLEFKYLDDAVYSLIKLRSGFAQGKSKRALFLYLTHKGVEKDVIASAFETYLSETENEDFSSSDIELRSALTYAKKKRLGAYHPKAPLEFELYQKHIARLARAGFSYDICKKALEAREEL